MRIAYVCVDPGIPLCGTKGASVHIQAVVRRLRRMGHEIEVHVARIGGPLPADLADVEAHEYRVRADGAADREKAQTRASHSILYALAEDPPDLVWERYSLFSTVAAEAKAAFGARTVLEVNAPLIDEQRAHRVLVDEERARTVLLDQCGRADVIACVSDPVRHWVERITGATTAVTVPNGVDLDLVRPVVEDPDRVIVAFVGTLKPWHGVDVLLEARALARTDWTIRIIGDGPARQALEQRAGDLGVAVDFRGAVVHERMNDALAGVAVAVAPYPRPVDEADHYFSPLKVYEYLAAGLPVVASAVGQIPGVLADCGVLVEPSDARGLADAIDALVEDPARRRQLGRAARRAAEERHGWDRVVDAIMTKAMSA